MSADHLQTLGYSIEPGYNQVVYLNDDQQTQDSLNITNVLVLDTQNWDEQNALTQSIDGDDYVQENAVIQETQMSPEHYRKLSLNQSIPYHMINYLHTIRFFNTLFFQNLLSQKYESAASLQSDIHPLLIPKFLEKESKN